MAESRSFYDTKCYLYSRNGLLDFVSNATLSLAVTGLYIGARRLATAEAEHADCDNQALIATPLTMGGISLLVNMCRALCSNGYETPKMGRYQAISIGIITLLMNMLMSLGCANEGNDSAGAEYNQSTVIIGVVMMFLSVCACCIAACVPRTEREQSRRSSLAGVNLAQTLRNPIRAADDADTAASNLEEGKTGEDSQQSAENPGYQPPNSTAQPGAGGTVYTGPVTVNNYYNTVPAADSPAPVVAQAAVAANAANSEVTNVGVFSTPSAPPQDSAARSNRAHSF